MLPPLPPHENEDLNRHFFVIWKRLHSLSRVLTYQSIILILLGVLCLLHTCSSHTP